MIVDGLLFFVGRIFIGFIAFVDGLIPRSWDLTGFAEGTSSGLTWLLNTTGQFGVWFPVNMTLTMAGLLLSAKVIGFTIHIIRICLSLITGGGGST